MNGRGHRGRKQGGCDVISSSSGGSITYGDCETFRISAGWLGSIVPNWGMLVRLVLLCESVATRRRDQHEHPHHKRQGGKGE